MDNEAAKEELTAIIAGSDSYAIWRTTGEDCLHFLSGRSYSVGSFEELGKQRGYVVAPFSVCQGCKPVVIEPDKLFTFQVPRGTAHQKPQNKAKKSKGDNKHEFTDAGAGRVINSEYDERFKLFHNAIQRGKFDKLVLSRKKQISLPDNFSAFGAFLTASRLYNDSYVYMCKTPHTGLWIGATPEILLSGSGNSFTTVALAGTKVFDDNLHPCNWDMKNRSEQGCVVDYLRTIVSDIDPSFNEHGPYPAKAGKLVHLKTVFNFTAHKDYGLGDLLERIHPTPAVCGFPKDGALSFILENEGYDREYYSGFVGKINMDNEVELYVNLRCMKIEGKSVVLYAGGGIVESSNAREEWAETERKMETMSDTINL